MEFETGQNSAEGLPLAGLQGEGQEQCGLPLPSLFRRIFLDGDGGQEVSVRQFVRNPVRRFRAVDQHGKVRCGVNVLRLAGDRHARRAQQS